MEISKIVASFLIGIFTSVGSFFSPQKTTVPQKEIKETPIEEVVKIEPVHTNSENAEVNIPRAESGAITVSTKPTTQTQLSKQKVYSHEELLSLAGDELSSGSVPLGDDRYVTSAPKKGYVYLCNVHKENPGSQVNGSWIHGKTWNYLEKISVLGSVSWPNAVFTNTIFGMHRILAGNALPVNHTTGTFPVSKSDPAAQFDSNPNTISAQTIRKSLTLSPAFSDTPYCMGGEVGIMLSGVPLFNAFDAGLRDAPAHELQDSCDGHPQGSGEYHYHSLSSCFADTSVSTVLGYAYDGFPITGSKVADKKYLTTDDLDICHGLVSEVMQDGKMTTTYHYVMTKDFPYSASCFRGKPISAGPSVSTGGQQGTQGSSPSPVPSIQNQGGERTPPQEAQTACQNKQKGASCSFTTPRGDSINGVCDTPPQSSLACVPR